MALTARGRSRGSIRTGADEANFREAGLNFPTRLIATGFFSGYFRVAPGTAGSLFALGVYCLLPPLDLLAWAVLIPVLFLVAVHASAVSASAWGEDPPHVVIDEIVGFFVTMCVLPSSVMLGVAGFLLFRLLDIVKPFPAAQMEALPGGWGMVMDDVVAGIYGNLALRGLLFLWPV